MANYLYRCFRKLGGREFYTGRYWNANGKGIAIVAVVTVGVDWTAYIGADDGQHEDACLVWTADHGAKLLQAEAELFFPEIELPYRR